MKKLISFGNTS